MLFSTKVIIESSGSSPIFSSLPHSTLCERIKAPRVAVTPTTRFRLADKATGYTILERYRKYLSYPINFYWIQ